MSGECVEELTKRVSSLIQGKLKQYEGVWRTLYEVDDALMRKYCDSIYEQVEDLFLNFDICVDEKKNKIVARVEELLGEFDRIQQELSVRIKRPYQDSDPLTSIITSVENELVRYRKIRAERLQKLEALRFEERRLCELLGVPLYPLQAEVPSETDLAELEQNFTMLQNLKMERWAAVMSARNQIQELLEKLETTPSPGLETSLLEENPSIKLNESTMRKINETVDRLEKKVIEETQFLHFQQERLYKLWDRINESDDYRNDFMRSICGVGKSAQDKISVEIARCEEVKRENLRPIINRIREQIVAMWDQLTYTDDQRQTFGAFNTDMYSEDVLDLHELELARLQDYYQTHKELYDLADKRNTLLERMEHLIQMASHPDRLKNRGGMLLREEKERKALEKSLPKIEADLKIKLIAYYEENDTPFLWHGANLLQKIFDEYREKTVTVCTPRTRVNFSRQQTALSNSITDSITSYSQFQMTNLMHPVTGRTWPEQCNVEPVHSTAEGNQETVHSTADIIVEEDVHSIDEECEPLAFAADE